MVVSVLNHPFSRGTVVSLAIFPLHYVEHTIPYPCSTSNLRIRTFSLIWTHITLKKSLVSLSEGSV